MARRIPILIVAVAFVVAVSDPAMAAPDPNVPNGIFTGTSSLGNMSITLSSGNSTVLSGFVVNRILLDLTDTGKFQGQSLWLELTSGSIYQEEGQFITGNNMFDQPGSFETSPTLPDDTFMTNGDTTLGDALSNTGAASQLYPNGATTTGFSQPADSAGTTKLNVTGVDLSPNNAGIGLMVAQITLLSQSNGFWEYGAISTTSDLQVGQGTITNGMLLLPSGFVIPLPAAAWMGLSLLGGIGTLRLLRRMGIARIA